MKANERKKVKKTDLQARLEQEGWEWLTNDVVYGNSLLEFHSIVPFPRSDLGLFQEYKHRGFADVLVTDAFDIYGNPLSDTRAIYVKQK